MPDQTVVSLRNEFRQGEGAMFGFHGALSKARMPSQISQPIPGMSQRRR
jgi:hypothetical protein